MSSLDCDPEEFPEACSVCDVVAEKQRNYGCNCMKVSPKNGSLDGVAARQALKLISCGCGKAVCKDTCTRKPCSEKAQVKGECAAIDLESTVALGKSILRDVSVAFIGSKLAYNSVPKCSSFNTRKSSIITPELIENVIVESKIGVLAKSAKPDSDNTTPKPPENADIIEVNMESAQSKQSLPMVLNCGCTLEPIPRRSSKIPKRIRGERRSNASAETEARDVVNVLKISQQTNDSDQDNPATQGNFKSRKSKDLNNNTTHIPSINVEDISEVITKQTRASDIEEHGVIEEVDTKEIPKKIGTPEGLNKLKKQSCGCNMVICKETCKYKPCKGATCGCNRETCKDWCKLKPCFKPVDAENLESQKEPVNVEVSNDVSEVITKQTRASATEEHEVAEQVNPEEIAKKMEMPEGVNKLKKQSCGCNRVICKDTCKFKPCKGTTCGCNREICKDWCKLKPCFEPVDAEVQESQEELAHLEVTKDISEVIPKRTHASATEGRGVSKEVNTEEILNIKHSNTNILPHYVKNLIGEIKCLCKKPELVPNFSKNESQFSPTISTLRLGLESLQEKCRNKDVIIDSLRKELQHHTGSKVFSEMLSRVAHPSGKKKDYDKYMVTQELPIPNGFKHPPICACTKLDGCCKIDPSPLQIVDVKKIAARCLLVKWITSNAAEVIGYEVCVGEVVVTRILHRERNSTVLNWETGFGYNKVNISIYAFTRNGRCFPPATADYKGTIN